MKELERYRSRKNTTSSQEENQCCDDPCIEPKDGSNVCVNCGTISGRILIGDQTRAFTKEEINKRRQTEPRWRGFGPRTIMPKTKDTLISRLSKIQNSLVSSIERNLWEARPKLNLLTSKMNLPTFIKETAWRIYLVVAKKKLTMGRTVAGFIAASLYTAIRVHEFPRLLEEVCDAAIIPRHTVHKSLGYIVKEVLPEMKLKYKPITAEQLVFRFGNDLDLPIDVQKDAVNMLIQASKNGLSRSGKDPKGLAASVIYMAAKAKNYRKTQAEVSHLAKITEVTLRSRCKQIRGRL